MRRLGVIIAVLILLSTTICSCNRKSGISQSEDVPLSDEFDARMIESDSTESIDSDDGEGYRSLAKVVRLVFGEDGSEESEVYKIDYSTSELRTTMTHRDAKGRSHSADAFFNVDGTLSFVRMRDAGGTTRTIHFVYDSNGNPTERIESQDDVPIEKIVYSYDDAKEYRRGLKLYEWSDGKWKFSNDRTLVLFVNPAGQPAAFESMAPEGIRTVVFEYLEAADTLDNYVDTATSANGEETSVSGFVSYDEGEPMSMVVRSKGGTGEESRIIGSWKNGGSNGERKLIAETVSRCGEEGCVDREQRKFFYEITEAKQLMPPASIMMPFLELGSSLVFIEEPDVLLGKEGIGLPSWIGL